MGAIEIPTTADNLVLKAVYLRQTTGVRLGVAITLKKRVPAAAGLGGGSSDAAATLLALNTLWQLGLSRPELVQLAARLGSDVPFFIANDAAALCTGRGEQIERLFWPLRLQLALAQAEKVGFPRRRCIVDVCPSQTVRLQKTGVKSRRSEHSRWRHNVCITHYKVRQKH